VRWWIAALAVASLSTSAHAEDPEAQRLLDEGTRLFTEDAAHQAAREAFQRSYDREPSWRALNGIALTFQEQGRFVDALVTYEKLLATFDAVLTDNQRTTVKARLESLETKIGVIELVANQPASVSIDSDDIGTGPLRKPIRLLPGRHVIIATLAGHQTLTRTIEVSAGERTSLAIVLGPERVVVKVEQTPLVRRYPKWMPYAVLGGGATLAIAGGILHAVSRSDFRAFDDSVEQTAGFPPISVSGDQGLHDRAVLEHRLAIGGYVLGGLALIAGGVLYTVNQPRPIPRVDIVPAGRGVAMIVRF